MPDPAEYPNLDMSVGLDRFVPPTPPDSQVFDSGATDQSPAPPVDATPNDPDAESPQELKSCREACQGSDDCLEGFECQDGFCERLAAFNLCARPDYCLANLSGWLTRCAGVEDCPAGEVCIRVQEEGRCALPASAGCPDAFIDLPRREFANMASELTRVCAIERAVCDEFDVCRPGCQSDDDCEDGQRPQCNVDTGRCTCTAESCSVNASRCGATGRCECVMDSDCSVGDVDVCRDGRCGCSADSVCADPVHPGGQSVCSP